MNQSLSNILSFQNCSQYHFDCIVSFTGKERDEETGYSYFGARYYDADLLTSWLSVDPMSDKYPSISPYNYCAWNPIRYIDPNGDSLWANKTSQQDLISLVKDKNKGRVAFDENGLLSVDMVGIKNKDYDKGLYLLYILSTANERYLYERSDVISAIQRCTLVEENSEGNLDTYVYYDCFGGPYPMNKQNAPHGIINASDGGPDSQTEDPVSQFPIPDMWNPKDGYNGHVIMSMSGSWTIFKLGGGTISNNTAFKSILFHELAENYFKTTTKGLPYHGDNGAHNKAVKLEGTSFYNAAPGKIILFSY